MNKSRNLIAVAVGLLLVASIVLAEVVQTGYRTIRGAVPASVAAQSSTTTAQSQVWSATPINPIETLGNPRVIVEGNFETASATCVVTVGRYHLSSAGVYTLLGIESQTLTAHTAETDAGLGSAKRYLAVAPKTFDLYAASHYDVRMAAPSSGSVTLTHYPYGSARRSDE